MVSEEEQNLKDRLFNPDFSFDEALRLYTIVTQRAGNFPLEWEERVLELGLTVFPDRFDMAARLSEVKRRLGHASTAALGRNNVVSPIVSLARTRLAAARSQACLPAHGVRWGAYVDQIRCAIERLYTPEETLCFAQTSIGFEHRGNIHHEGKFTAMYERELYAEFPQFSALIDKFSDISGSAPETTYEHKGRLVSNVMFYLARVVLVCLTHIPSTNIVLEIGGGYGAPARMWLRNPIRQPKTYIILDIPESLFFADVFLRREFGDANVYYVENEAPVDPSILRNHCVILCPLSFHAALFDISVDLVINTGSMQEMNEEWVNFYTQWLDRQHSRWFYSLNYFGQPISYLAESANLWSPRPSAKWAARLLRINPGLVRMQSERNFLEALYEKNIDSPSLPSREIKEAEHLHFRYMTVDLLVEYMEIIRCTASVTIMVCVARRIMKEMPYHPKETAFLVDAVLTRTDDREIDQYRAELENYRTILQKEREAGTEAIH